MEQHKVRSYLLYALGEIALVMIGILLALQVNNWNEQRKEDSLEIHLLKNLHSDLQDTIASGQKILQTDSTIAANLRGFLFEEQKRDSMLALERADSLIIHFLWTIEIEVPVLPIYEDIKNSGSSNLITNQEIRNKLAEVDELTFLLRFQIADKTQLQQNFIDELIAQKLHMSSYVRSLYGAPRTGMPQNTFQILIEDEEFHNRLNMKVVIGDAVLKNRRDLQNGLTALIQLVEKELQQRLIS